MTTRIPHSISASESGFEYDAVSIYAVPGDNGPGPVSAFWARLSDTTGVLGVSGTMETPRQPSPAHDHSLPTAILQRAVSFISFAWVLVATLLLWFTSSLFAVAI